MNVTAPPLHLETVAALLETARGRVDIQVLPECDSSNTRLMQMARAGAPLGTVLCAEQQRGGRGRRGRVWHQGTHGLAFSLLWRLPAERGAEGLSLAVGLAVAEAVGEAALLKWPNDVLLDQRKIAGILIESPAAGVYVIGIGINVGDVQGLPAEVVTLAAATAEVNRETMLARTLNRLVVILDAFAATGFAGLRERWMARHAFQDREVAVAELGVHGRCCGVGAAGALLIETAQGLVPVLSGDVSVRMR